MDIVSHEVAGEKEWFSVVCGGCSARVGNSDFDMPKTAVDAWNRRAGRTCRNEATEPGILFECSECHAAFVNEPIDGWWDYCPNCGAKVVER